MKKKDFVTQLMKQGWSRYLGSNVERWQRGDALLSIFKDPCGRYCVSNSTGDVALLSEIIGLSFTPYRVFVTWDEYNEWYILY